MPQQRSVGKNGPEKTIGELVEAISSIRWTLVYCHGKFSVFWVFCECVSSVSLNVLMENPHWHGHFAFTDIVTPYRKCMRGEA
jgi:hypothetical protein